MIFEVQYFATIFVVYYLRYNISGPTVNIKDSPFVKLSNGSYIKWRLNTI
jgi:hypothetical protein